jgi:putative ATP-dependent endonuclease of the OLD family
MHIVRLHIRRFRAIRDSVQFPLRKNALLGPNNVGKTAILEALNLLLTPHASSRSSLVDENDFFGRAYLPLEDGTRPTISVEAVIAGLTEEDADVFHAVLLPWRALEQTVVERADEGDPFKDAECSIRPTFEAWYDPAEDAFEWLAFHRTDSLLPREQLPRFTRDEKRHIGFLIYRDFRALHRPITLEPTALFDRLLRSKSAGARNFDAIFDHLAGSGTPLFADTPFREAVDSFGNELARYLPLGDSTPSLKFEATDRTRAEVRAALQLYIEGAYALPLQKQGAGTRSLAILAMLLVILRNRGRGILALEEPETFLFPHAQRRVIDEVQKLCDQLFLTTHAPTVLERMPIDGLQRVQRTADGLMTVTSIATDASQIRNVRRRLRRQLAEALLGRAAIVVEEEATRVWLLQASTLLHGTEVAGEPCETFDLLGISVVSADGNGEVPELCETLARAGIQTFGFIDATRATTPIDAAKYPRARVVYHAAQGLEDLLLASLDRVALTTAMTTAPFVKENSDAATLAALDATTFSAKAREFLRHNKGSIPFHEWLAEQTPRKDLPGAFSSVVRLAMRVAAGRETLTASMRAL